MNVLSLFSGIGGLELGLERAGMRIVAQVEIDAPARSVLAHHWPDVPRFEDVRKVTADDITGPVDLVCAGFPCQDVSVAGRRAGLAGARTGLFWHIVRLADALHPRWLVLENVPGLLSSNDGRDMGAVIGALAGLGYGYCWRVLDAQHFGVPQRRRRLFIVGCAGDGAAPVQVLLEPESVRRDPAPGAAAGSRVAALTANGVGAGGGPDDNAAQAGHLVTALTSRAGATYDDQQTGQLVSTLMGGSPTSYRTGPDEAAAGHLIPFAYQCHGGNVGPMGTLKGDGSLGGGVPFTTHALTAEGADASEDGTGRGTPLVPYRAATLTSGSHNSNIPGRRSEDDVNLVPTLTASMGSNVGHPGDAGKDEIALAVAAASAAVRRLTPVECERLQGFPDNWTASQSDSQRYRQLGNAVAVPVAEWIGRRILDHDQAVTG